MEDKQKNVIKNLHELIEVCKEGERGYKEASDNVNDEDLKTILYRLSQQRALFRGELEQVLIKDYGDDPKDEDSLLSKIHRGWMDFKAGLSGKDTKAVLAECERGETRAIEKYSKALKGSLPEYVEEIVQKQFDMIKGTFSQIKEFEAETAGK